MENKLNDTSNEKEEENEVPKESKSPNLAKILIIALIVFITGLIIGIIIYAITKSNDDKNDEEKNDDKDKEDDKDDKDDDEDDEDDWREIYEKAGYIESWNDLYGIQKSNLSYAKNDKIINSFKKGGDNYNETMGEINEGNDYPINERNKYSLYIPYSSLNQLNKYNGIFLFIHGGSWTGGNKEDIEFLSRRYAKWDI